MEQKYGHGSRWGSTPRITMLANASSKLLLACLLRTNRAIFTFPLLIILPPLPHTYDRPLMSAITLTGSTLSHKVPRTTRNITLHVWEQRILRNTSCCSFISLFSFKASSQSPGLHFHGDSSLSRSLCLTAWSTTDHGSEFIIYISPHSRPKSGDAEGRFWHLITG
jgi:hypothetical protein